MFKNRPALKTNTTTINQEEITKISELEKEFYSIRKAVQEKLLENDNDYSSMDSELLRSMIEDCFNQVLEEQNILYNHAERTQVFGWVIADIIGYGPIEPLLNDERFL